METKSGLYSHPCIFIEDHTNKCLDLLNFYLQRGVSIADGNFIISAIVLTALHDFGKGTKYFQDYITGKTKKSKLSEHSLISSIYVFHCIKNILPDQDLLAAFSFVACKRHHTDPNSFIDEFAFDDRDIRHLQKQVDSINQEKTNIYITNLNLLEDLKKNIFFDKEKFKKELFELTEEISSFRSFFRQNIFKRSISELCDFIKFQYLFSLLLDSDKTEAGARSFIPKRISHIPIDVVSRYKANHLSCNREIDSLREKAYQRVLNHKIDLSQKMYSITLPTGMGKTLTGFAFALKLREAIKKEKGVAPRIIYTLPFISIIDQNAEVLKNVLETEFNQIDGKILLKHHHLSEPKFEEYDFGEARLLTEGWNSEVIITTFVQLFHTLVSTRNSEFRRFNKLGNSILLIDEVQALSTKYWHLIREMLKEVSRNLNTYIVLMTATQPYLLEEALELANPQEFKNKLNRIRVFINLEKHSLDEFVKSMDFQKDKTYLFITNTINSSKEFYHLLKKSVGEDVCYLSTSVLPCERAKRIEDIKKGKYRFVVSTQLVEAGVDIDFDIVYRDFAPFDSLYQSAGRCNRNMEKKKGEFYVMIFTDSGGNLFYPRIYDPVLCHITKKVLKDKQELTEQEFSNLIEKYYRMVWEEISQEKSKNLLEAIKSFRFSTDFSNSISIKDFQLIEDDKYKKDVFIEINNEATQVWNKAKSIIRKLREKVIDFFSAKEEFDKLKPDFYKFVISANIEKNIPPYDEELKIYFVNKNMLKSYYSSGTGFIEKGEAFLVV
jgi:CRISPR-associated endonuclease/helicase Cas3